jgi:hypothetical protein
MNTLLRRSAALIALAALCMCTGVALAHNDVVRNPNIQVPGQPIAEDLRLNYLSESFEDAVPPAGWHIMSSGASSTWVQTTQAANSGAASAAVFYGDPGAFQDEWLVLPALDLSGATAPGLEFFEMEAYWSGYGLRHHIMVSTTSQTDPGSFSSLITWTPGDHTIGSSFDEPTLVDLTSLAGESVVYLAFRYEGDWADDWLIDDVRVFEPSDHDVAAINALPIGHVDDGVALVPQGVVKNVGLNTESFDALYEIFDAGSLVYSETGYVSGLAMGAEATVDFPAFTPASGLFYTTVFSTQLAGDEDTSNDSFTAGFDTYLLGHVPLMFLFTNSGCGPCVQANVAWDDYMETAGNTVALMRVHTWWPNPSDIMFTANEEQCTAYTEEYGVSGVPDMWLDGLTGLGFDGPGSVAAADAARFEPSPMTVTPVFWDMGLQQVMVEVDVAGTLPDSDYRLVACITEDNIVHSGGNGEPIHMQAFRRAYPALEGMPIDVTPGLHTYVVEMPLEEWVYDELRVTAYVQDRGSAAPRDIIESGTDFLGNIDDVTPVAVSGFDLTATPGQVAIVWNCSEAGAEFRLTRVIDGASSELSFSADTAGRYQASDEVSESGLREYRLQGRLAGEDWMLIRSDNVQASAPVLRSHIANNYPNPFNPKTDIRFSVAESGLVRLSVFDLQGRQVATLFEGVKEPGDHVVSWDAQGQGSGIYFVQLTGQGFSDSRKVVLTK